MSHNYKEVVNDISAQLAQMNKAIPATMAGFGQMAKATHSDGALDKKTKELIAMAIGIAARCQGCLGFHAKACVGGPSVMTGAEALQAYEGFGGEKAA